MCNICDVFTSALDAVMTNAATFLPLLLWLYCYGNCSTDGLLTGSLTQADLPHQECHSSDPDDEADLCPGTGSKSSARSTRSACKEPLGSLSFLSCYDVTVPVFSSSPILGAGPGDRPVTVPVSMTALGRPFRLRLYADDLSGEGDGLKPEMAWSSVVSTSTVVRVLGGGANSVREYRLRELGITWYTGRDDFEVAPSVVLASVVDVNDTHLLRAVIRTTEDNYYVQPASDYPGVKRAFA